MKLWVVDVRATKSGSSTRLVVGRFDSEWAIPSQIGQERSLLTARGWRASHHLVFDLSTRQGFLWSAGGLPEADLNKHAIAVSPEFLPFLHWCNKLPLRLASELPSELTLKGGRLGVTGTPIEATGQIIEAHDGGFFNWGKFLVLNRPDAGAGLQYGWAPDEVLLVDLQTGEGFLWNPTGQADEQLDQTCVWVCPMMSPFLQWYNERGDCRRSLPAVVNLGEVPTAMGGYRRGAGFQGKHP